jgi:hypothetical protein
MSKNKNNKTVEHHGPDNEKIAALADKLVAPAFAPYELWDHVFNFIWDKRGNENLTALYTAIYPAYPELKAQYEAGPADADIGVDVATIEQQAMYFIGLAVGRRVKSCD